MSRRTTLARKVEEIRAKVIEFCRRTGIRHLASSLSCVGILVELFYEVVRLGDVVVLSKGHASPVWWCIYRDQNPREIPREGDEGMAAHLPLGAAGMTITTGSLGHGLGIGIGFALGHPESRVYVVMGDAELCEGSVWEAVTLAYARRLNNIIAIVDWNKAGATGMVADMGIDNILGRFAAFGWGTASHMRELRQHRYANKVDMPRVVVVSTTKGQGVPELESDPAGCHGRLS